MFRIPFFIAKLGVFIIERMSIELVSTEQLELYDSNSLLSNIDKKLIDLDIKPPDIRKTVNNYIKKNSYFIA